MNLRQEAAPDATTQVSPVPVRLRIAGFVLRALFIAALLVVIVRPLRLQMRQHEQAHRVLVVAQLLPGAGGGRSVSPARR